MAKKKSEIIAFFVQEMYVILFGVGLSNIIFLKKIDISSIQGIGYVLSAIFVIGVTIRYWLDWATYISGEIRSTNNEFVIDFAILINLLLLFGYYQDIKVLAILFFSLSVFDGFWVLNYVTENSKNLREGVINSRKWILEKLVGSIIFAFSAGMIWITDLHFLIQLSLILISFISVRKLSFRSVKKARGLVFEEAKISDLDDITRIHNDNARKNLKRLNQGFLLGELNQDILREKLNGKGNYKYFVALQDKSVVGFVQFHSGIPEEEWEEFSESEFIKESKEYFKTLTKSHQHILTVATSVDHKGLGIGSFLYTSLFKKYTDTIFSAFVVTSPFSNQASISFHENHMFKTYSVFKGGHDYKIANYSSSFMVREAGIEYLLT